MRPARRLLAVVGLLVGVGLGKTARAQSVDLVSAGAQYMPSATMPGPTGAVQVASYDVAVNVPVPLAPKTFLIPGTSYHVDAVSFAGTAPEFVELRAFQALDLSTLVVQVLPANWSIAARVSTGLAGDFQGLDTRMLRASALATATHAFSKRFVLGGGGLTTFGFGSFLPLPALYFDWRPFEGARIEGFLPAFVHARYTFFDRLRVGLLADFNGNEYAVRDRRIRDAYPCAGQPNDDPATPFDERSARPAECFDNLAYSVGSAGLAVGVRLVSSVWLGGFFGHSFFRRLDRRNAARDLLPEGRDEIPNVLVVRTTLTWRLPGVD